MKLHFSKYQGAGNDFIMLDNRSGIYDSLTLEQIRFLCDRKFGIGADGLIKINLHKSLDFEADYYNADGSKSFCGNGGRCAVSFCSDLGMNVTSTSFLGYDGKHRALMNGDEIQLEMTDVHSIQSIDADFELYTGSPHYVHFSKDISDFDVYEYGKNIRYNNTYKKEGINVNIVEELAPNHLYVRTYERGVENETLACGTGVTACAIAYVYRTGKIGDHLITIKVQGGELKVRFQYDGTVFTNVWLIGPGTFVFEGTIDV
jgi:diaminopimelate epimerase